MPRVNPRWGIINSLGQAAQLEVDCLASDSTASSGYQELVGPLENQDSLDDGLSDLMVNSDDNDDFLMTGALSGGCGTDNLLEPDKLTSQLLELSLGFCLIVMINILSSRYLLDRRRMYGDKTLLDRLLKDWKLNNPAKFRRWLRINPQSFDALAVALSEFEGFHNKAYLKQAPVEVQLAIALYRLGSFGNRGGVCVTADIFGVSYGFVLLATNRVILAALTVRSVVESVRWPSPQEREAAKATVMDFSDGNADLSNGWIIQDGTLVRIYQRPHFCGSMFFDRKSRYSLNVQITTLPSGAIVDYTCGHVGSAHDSLSFRSTRLYNDQKTDGPKELLGPNEFCWADSAYSLSSWLIKPYSDKELEGSRKRKRFNRILSRIRVKSEHSIGYLKGRFQSLQGLRIIISKEEDMGYCAQWIRACIHIHMFVFPMESTACDPSETFCRRGLRRERRQARRWRKAEARRHILGEEQVGSRQGRLESRRIHRLHLELGKIRRDRLCESVKNQRKNGAK